LILDSSFVILMSDPLLEYRARLLDRLEAVVPELADAMAAIPESRWPDPVRQGGRSPHALVAHLRDMEREAYSPRLRRLLSEESPAFDPWDSPDWETEIYNPNEPLAQILADYAGLREAELQVLYALQPKEWSRTGRHFTLGRRSLQWWVERMLAYAEDSLSELRSK